MARQEIEQLQLLRRHFKGLVAIGHLVLAQTDREAGEAQLPAIRLRGLEAAQHGLDAREQLLRLKRFGDIIVRAELEAEHLVERFVLRGQHDDRHVRRFADFAQHLPAVHAGQHQIQQNQIRREGLELLHGRVAAVGHFHLEALFFQIEIHQLANVRIVVHEQNLRFHRSVPPMNRVAQKNERRMNKS